MPADPALVPVALGAAVAALLLAGIAGWARVRSDPADVLAVGDVALLRPRRARRARRSVMAALGAVASRRLQRALGPARCAALGHRLELAGSPGGDDVAANLARRARLAMIFGAGAAVLLAYGQPLVALLVLVTALVLPELALRRAGRARQERIERDLPDFLDVLAVTVSAGLGFRTALARVVERTRGPVAQEFQRAMDSMRLGTSRHDAFDGVRRRNAAASLEAFVSALLQAEELGSPLGEALEQIARDVRRVAAQGARRRAARTSPRITLVVTLVMAPGAMVLLVVGLVLGSGIDLGALLG